jgi:hypothetical protein
VPEPRPCTGERHGLGAELLFATVRKTALGFYVHCGMQPGGMVTVEEIGFEVRYVMLDREGLRRLCGHDS